MEHSSLQVEIYYSHLRLCPPLAIEDADYLHLLNLNGLDSPKDLDLDKKTRPFGKMSLCVFLGGVGGGKCVQESVVKHHH